MGGEGFISAGEIEAYCNLIGLQDPDERRDLFRLIRAMDATYLAEQARKRVTDDKAG